MSPADINALLRRHPLFASLDEAAVQALSLALVWFCLPGGRPLFKCDEPADALYMLHRGSLGVFSESTTLTQQIGAGAVVGEVSLLGDGIHHQTVRALRDCELWRLDRDSFDALIQRYPGLLLQMTRQTVGHLQSRADHERQVEAPGTFAILPLDRSVPARALAMQFVMALEAYGSCLIIDSEQGAWRDSAWFAEREAAARFVIYLDSSGDATWRQRCLRQADVLLLPVLASSTPRFWPEATMRHSAPARHRPRHLLLLHPGHQSALGSAQRWRHQFSDGVHHHHICGNSDIHRVARRISGHGHGLVLAGGGARGLAHLGALRALHEAGYVFDAIGGTSIGAIVGAGIAAGWSAQETTERCVHAFVQGRPLSDWTLPLVALTRGRRASNMLQSTFGELMIEDLPLPLFCISTSLSGDGQVVHRQGPLWLWLRASSAIPGVLPPVFQHGRVYVDGAMANNLPTDVMAADGLTRITALDVRAEITLQADVDESSTPSLWQLMWQKRRRLQRPGLVSTLVRAGMVNSDEAALHRRSLATLLITPPLEQIGMLDWKNWRRAVEIGYQHTIEVLEANASEQPCSDRSSATVANTKESSKVCRVCPRV